MCRSWGYGPDAVAGSLVLRRLGERQGDTVALAVFLTAPIGADVAVGRRFSLWRDLTF